MRTLLALVTFTAPLLAQASPATRPASPKGQADFVKLREEKLAKPVFKLAKWNTDYDAVRAEAKKTGKPIFAYFTRSYAH